MEHDASVLEAQLRAEHSAAESLDIARHQVSLGAMSYLVVLNAEQTYQQAVIGLVQGKAQVEAAHEAVTLADQTSDAERKKLLVGISTPYTVVLRERDAIVARQELQRRHPERKREMQEHERVRA